MVYMKKGGCIKLCDAVTAEKLKGQGYTPLEVNAPQTGAQAAQDETKGNPDDKPDDKPDGNTEDKPDGNTEDKPDGNTEDKPKKGKK